MNIADIIALAKQGYKKDDIKELIALAEETEKKPSADPQPEDKPDTSGEKQPTDSGNESAQVKAEPNDEILNRIKELEEQNKSLTEQLKEAQKQNIDKDHSDQYKQINPMEAVAELFRKG